MAGALNALAGPVREETNLTVFSLGPSNGLYFEYDPPATAGRSTLVFVNALTGNTGAWQAAVAPRCRAAGLGTLCWNYRGQQDSPFSDHLTLDAALITADLRRLVEHVAPPRPLPVGLSIGGLYAARAVLAGMPAERLVLLNTLRRIGPRIAWINDAMLAAVRTGGVPMLLDMFMPLLTNQAFQAANRTRFLTGATYVPQDPAHGHVRLMEAAGATDWDLPYEDLDLPVLTITGLQDRLFLDPPIVEALRQRLPHGRHLMWDDAGHLLPQEHPTRLAEALTAFATEA